MEKRFWLSGVRVDQGKGLVTRKASRETTSQRATEILKESRKTTGCANRARYEEDPESKGGREPKRYREALTPKRATKRAPY